MQHKNNLHDVQKLAVAIRNRLHWQQWHTEMATLYLQMKDSEQAAMVIQKALAIPSITFHFQALVLQGMIHLQNQRSEKALYSFKESLSMVNMPKITHLYRGKYATALAYAGLATITTHKNEQVDYAQKAREAYQNAKSVCSAEGVLTEASRLLKILPEKLENSDFAAILGG